MRTKTKPSSSRALTIGQVAKLAGVGIQTIRFYEREKVIEEPVRRESGYRQYDEEIVRRLRFIKRAQALGFSLREISSLLALRVNPKESCKGVKKQAEEKLEEIERKIDDLKRMQKVLNDVTRACVASRPIADCPILQCFEEESR
jgi:MerR family transcriptional regulator, copper efflux regulator